MTLHLGASAPVGAAGSRCVSMSLLGNAALTVCGGAGVWTVFSEPPCASGSQLVDLVPTSAVPAETAGASAGSAAPAAIETGAVVPETAAAAGGLGSSALVVGGLVVAGGAALALASGGGGSSKSKPVSP